MFDFTVGEYIAPISSRGTTKISGEILTCFKKNNIFLAQILTKLKQFENKENLWKFCIENP